MDSPKVIFSECKYDSACLGQIQKGKLHGSIDVGLSVMSIKKRARRIDLDTEEHIYHLKVRGWEGEDNVIVLDSIVLCVYSLTKQAADPDRQMIGDMRCLSRHCPLCV